MKYLTSDEKHQLAGDYFAPEGLYEYIKSLPFTGRVKSNITSLTAGEWTEILLEYEVGGSGLADGAWIKGTFKFYSDWALFQTSDPTKDNYVSAEYVPNTLFPGQTPSTVQSLGIRFDQKGHERPFQKAVIVDIQDGYLNPGDKILIRLGDRRFRGKGTRVQTFVEKDFRWRFYIDPVGTSRFAPIQPDISWDIVPGRIQHMETVSPRLLRPSVPFEIHTHAEDSWGNVSRDQANLSFRLRILNEKSEIVLQRDVYCPSQGWTNIIFSDLQLAKDGDYTIQTFLLADGDYKIKNVVVAKDGRAVVSKVSHITVSSDLTVPKILFGDLHVHSDDTVGTESSTYNFTYGREIAGLDVLGYTANDFQITKARWDATVELIKSLNEPGKFVVFPGTEWCGNSAVGGDHNVVFLADPATHPPEFPFDRHGNVARSFEWSEDGPEDLIPGTWPLDEVYCTYAHDAENNLLIPHVGGRRCNLAWHHPKLERLVEIGSAWGQFEWLIRDAVNRGWKLGVSANSDEHRGRCGGGVPGTAVFGTRGGLTGIVAQNLDRENVARSLRARYTFATTGQRLVGLLSMADGSGIQGDEVSVQSSQAVELDYHFLGQNGFSSIEAFDGSGLIWSRSFWSESKEPATILRITWGGARLYDRYREAIWNGHITVSDDSTVQWMSPFGGFENNLEDRVTRKDKHDKHSLAFSSKTSGDLDGVNLHLKDNKLPSMITVTGSLAGYVKVGDALAGNPHKAQPTFSITASLEEALVPNGKRIEIKGGAELFVCIEAIPDIALPRRVQGRAGFPSDQEGAQSIYFVGREWTGTKVVTSPIFINRV
ncbi:hypothetical protein N7493_008768 [Penicillium malachiteum]|uniref:DUF3604 domain-containing protein n=1 Tax=Penicillium malachiteum TaxID=1324776 RepID=A0AAD6HFK5_9EURO|nr:hypothetical protein N7493_008768 [Penicillium malachiteum]